MVSLARTRRYPSVKTTNADYAYDVGFISDYLNPFFPNAPFFYPLRTSQNLMVF